VTRPEPLPELGFYGLPGHTDSPRDLLDECRRAEEIGLGACFISERFNVKESASLTGAACAVTDRLGVATSVTNHNTRHPMVTAAWATTLHRLSEGRFSLGLGRGFDPLFSAIGLQPITMKQIEDFVGIVRRLWKGETILGHDGPAGTYPFLRLDERFDEDIPVMLAALGPKTMTWGGGVFDGVMLHTFFTDQTLRECVDRIRAGAEKAGRDPNLVRVWAVLAVLTDLPEEARLKMLVGRMGTYLQAYGDALVTINGWDPKVLADFRAAPQVLEVSGTIDAVATRSQLEAIAELIPEEWLAASAVGSPDFVASRIEDQLSAGADGVILHASTPDQLAGAVDAYRARRPADRFAGLSANPGR
jgi:probable F420-dependent oxidoreductase